MIRILSTSILLLLLFTGKSLAQQDPLYNQYLFNQAMVNPAYTGIHGVTQAQVITRAQWLGLDGAPLTNTLNFHTSILDNKIGLGALLINDQLGVNSNTEFHLAYSYNIDLGSGKLSMGLQTGIINYAYDYSKLDLDFLDDPNFIPETENLTEPNFGAGLFYMSERWYMGVSVPRILSVEVSDGVATSTRYQRHYYVSGGFILDQLFALKFKPSFLLKVVDGAPAALDINGSFLLNETLWLGATLRNLNSVGAHAILELKNAMRIGYSFELPSNQLITSGIGSHEVMVAIDIGLFSTQAVGIRYF